jgi:hypothetical protein
MQVHPTGSVEATGDQRCRAKTNGNQQLQIMKAKETGDEDKWMMFTMIPGSVNVAHSADRRNRCRDVKLLSNW